MFPMNLKTLKNALRLLKDCTLVNIEISSGWLRNTNSLEGVAMTKNKLFVGFRNGKVLAMVFTSTQNYETAVDCDRFVEAEAGTEKQQLAEWFSQQEKKGEA